MPFSLYLNVDGLVKRLDTAAETARDLKEPLKKFGLYMRKRAVERYKAQDFAPLAASTLAQRAAKGVHSLENTLSSDVRRAVVRERANAPKAKQSFVEKLMGKQPIGIVTAHSKGVTNRMAVLAEFQRRHSRGAGGLKERAGGKELTLKQMESLSARTSRAVNKAVGRPILGKLASTLKVVVDGDTVTLVSLTKEHWTEVHNMGGTAGHGAKIPERKTILLEEKDVQILAEILKEHCLLPLQQDVTG